MTDQALTIQPRALFNPEKDTMKAKKAADRLIDIVKQNNWSIKVGGKSEHLMYEAWQTVGKYYNISVGTGEVEQVEIFGVQGFKAKAWAIDNRTGVRVGEAEAYCMRDEANWKGKPVFQLASMAQTRAGSKALRQIFGFVVALAGYSPTPVEEMIGEGKDPAWIKEADNEPRLTFPQTRMIISLLQDKGYTEEDLKSKYQVSSIGELSKSQASQIIENLLKLPNKNLAQEGEVIESEINMDEVSEAMANNDEHRG